MTRCLNIKLNSSLQLHLHFSKVEIMSLIHLDAVKKTLYFPRNNLPMEQVTHHYSYLQSIVERNICCLCIHICI